MQFQQLFEINKYHFIPFKKLLKSSDSVFIMQVNYLDICLKCSKTHISLRAPSGVYSPKC